jgi:hypothetical protein
MTDRSAFHAVAELAGWPAAQLPKGTDLPHTGLVALVFGLDRVPSRSATTGDP